ncbi:MAG: hypothetical protein SH809_01215 [Rhodothermales bacterium]|nr:hypothetical protein [Rhodothermales bacterium]
MQQTILAFGALMITMMITVNQQQSIFRVQQLSYVRELENAAIDFGARQLEEIMNTVAFDEATVGATKMTFGAGDFSQINEFGHDSGENGANKATFDDLDDYDGFEETATHVMSADTFMFHVSYAVEYVSPSSPNTSPSSATFAKQITATIESDTMVGDKRAHVVMKRVTIVTDSF